MKYFLFAKNNQSNIHYTTMVLGKNKLYCTKLGKYILEEPEWFITKQNNEFILTKLVQAVPKTAR